MIVSVPSYYSQVLLICVRANLWKLFLSSKYRQKKNSVLYFSKCFKCILIAMPSFYEVLFSFVFRLN